MNKRPTNVVMAAALAVIGGLVAIAFLAVAIMNISADNGSFDQSVFAMLIAVLFFGLAGQLYPNGKSSYLPVVILGLINVIVITVAIVTDVSNNFNFGIALFIIAILDVLLLLPACTEKWVNFDRS